MNIQEYIRSGIIETYVLGLADEAEVREMEAMRRQHPEIENAVREFEIAFESKSREAAIPVRSDLKSRVFDTLQIDQVQDKYATPGSEKAGKPASLRVLKWLAAASIILLVISCGLNIYTYYRYKELQSENRDLVLQRDRLFVDNGSMQARMQDLDSGLRAINSPGVIRISLKGVAGKEGSEAIVYWSKSTTDVYISLLHLPQAPAGKQYQLWALLDGKPIDAGVLGNCVSICRQKNISNAQAFAITLEKEGGSQSPTLSQLYVMGKI